MSDLRETLAEHFVMYHDRDLKGPIRGEWRCACGKKFGFSDSAITHQAEALTSLLASKVEAVSERLLRLRDRTSDPRAAGAFEQAAHIVRSELDGGAA